MIMALNSAEMKKTEAKGEQVEKKKKRGTEEEEEERNGDTYTFHLINLVPFVPPRERRVSVIFL
jgi:hypothetical protein